MLGRIRQEEISIKKMNFIPQQPIFRDLRTQFVVECKRWNEKQKSLLKILESLKYAEKVMPSSSGSR